MAYFADADDLYATLGALFRDLAGDEQLWQSFTSANTIVRYEYRDPQAQVTIRLESGEPPQVDLGESEMEPEVVMTMDADVGHRFWLGDVNVTVALARGEIRARGPVAKILKLVPLAKSVFPRYKAMLEQMGRSDLVEAGSSSQPSS